MEFETLRTNTERSSCQFCGNYLSAGVGVLLRECLHTFCRKCLKTHIAARIESADGRIPCPDPLGEDCTGNVTNSELKAILPPSVYQVYEDTLIARRLETNEYIVCKKPGCDTCVAVDGKERTFRCQACNSLNCVSCGTVHTGETCSEWQQKWNSATGNGRGPTNLNSSTNQCSISNTFHFEEDLQGKCQCCGIPFKDINDAVMLQQCSHVFCRGCLKFVIEYSTQAQIQCLVSDSDEGCDGYLIDSEVKALVSSDVYEQYLNRSVAVAQRNANAFVCKTPDCQGWCEFEVGRKTFLCPLCNKSNCLECRCIHDGMTCDTYQNLCRTGQQAKVKELMDKERRNGWSQLVQNLQIDERNGQNVHSVLGDMLQKDILYNTMEFECLICFTDIPVGEGVILQECLHMFCIGCLSGVIENSEDALVKCPYLDENYSCVCYIKEREIRSLVSKEIHEKHLTRSVKLGESSIENSFHCKTPDCPGWCVYDEGGENIPFECFVCGKKNCIACMAQHEGVKCEDYKNRITQNQNEKLSEEALEELVRKGEYMRCPKCKIHVQKIAGCDWLQCPRCRTEICWVTRGPRWGPKGRGDTTGGCRCNFATGNRCHPKCGNCH